MITFSESKRYISPLLMATLMLLVTGCGFGPIESFNAETSKVDMIFYFLPNTPSDEKDKLWLAVLNVPREKGGSTFLPGMVGVLGCESPQGKASICIDLEETALREQRKNSSSTA